LNPGLSGKKPVTDCLSHVVVAVVVIVATTTAAAVQYSYTKIFYLKLLVTREMEVGV
jgi:hypothetical protein